MSPSEKLEMKEQFESIKEIIELKLKNIEDKLDRTIIQTTKTNGTVTRHTEQIFEGLAHYAELKSEISNGLAHSTETCPHKSTIVELRDGMMTAKSMKRLMISGITITGIVVGVMGTLFALVLGVLQL